MVLECGVRVGLWCWSITFQCFVRAHSHTHSHTHSHSHTLTLTLKHSLTSEHNTHKQQTGALRHLGYDKNIIREAESKRASTYVFRVMDTGYCFCGQSLRTCETTTILVECSSHDRSCVLVLCYSEQSDTHVLCMYHERQSIEKLVRVLLFENGVFVHSFKLIHNQHRYAQVQHVMRCVQMPVCDPPPDKFENSYRILR